MVDYITKEEFNKYKEKIELSQKIQKLKQENSFISIRATAYIVTSLFATACGSLGFVIGNSFDDYFIAGIFLAGAGFLTYKFVEDMYKGIENKNEISELESKLENQRPSGLGC